ncbi:hypothetical protein [Desulfonema magnum]|uniref:P-loop domain-containing protein n=1 Tax=Desulfonema magnum TaxID=45655 RepID=A0A975GLB9_9BACT|nr:hypothetical protein [Desulfonema magnum]QTA85410.1 p-loop domain-containing protein [Desulfonema magnum]
MRAGEYAGNYQEGYEDYGQLFTQVGKVSHRSCILLTSREKPKEIAMMEGDNKPVRSLLLGGLDESDARNIFSEIGDSFSGSDEDWQKLVRFYNGNPLALKLAARHINEVFFGDISEFLRNKEQIFYDLKDLLDWHFERMSDAEKEIMCWMAINREPVSKKFLLRYLTAP